MCHRIAYSLLFSLLISAHSHATEPASTKLIRLAATTSIENSGLLKFLLPKFSARHPYEFDLRIVGSGNALRLGRTGKVDMVWVHSPAAEEQFVEEGYGKNRQTVMRNDFVIAGPTTDPGKIASAANALDALARISSLKLPFVSRADDSGTNKTELALWKKANIDPYGQHWYLEAGLGMAAALQLAEQKNAYLLIDRATYTARNAQKLQILLEDLVNLANPYSVIAVNPAKNDGINANAVGIFIDWLISAEGQQAIGDFQYDGKQLFTPLHNANKIPR